MDKKLEMEELIEKIKDANRKYYLLGESDISDAEYDSLVESLRLLDPKNPFLNKVGDDSSKNKVTLPITMGSLNKCRPDDNNLVKLYNKQDLVKMPKLDGLSGLAEYKDGKFIKLYTRGSGYEGQEITYRGNLMNFPKEIDTGIFPGTTYIIGEMIISKENFKKVQGSYKHPRNTVGGTLRPILTDEDYSKVDDSIKYNCSLIDFVVYGVVNEDGDEEYLPLFTDTLRMLEKMGFITAEYETVNCNDITPKYLSDQIRYYKTSYSYLTDGIVLRVNNQKIFNALGKEANGLNPKGSRAIKANLDDQFSQVGTIKDIEWNISKRGLFVPTVLLRDTLLFDGVEVDRVNGINVAYVKENNWGPEARIKLVRSGDVIPRIIATDSRNAKPLNIPTECPYCHSKLEDNGTHIYCPNSNCRGRDREGIISFFTLLKIENVSYETIASLYDLGFTTIESLLQVTYNTLIALDGYQAKKAISVENGLKNALKDITLAKLLYISQCFQNEKTSLGETKLQWIVDAYGEDILISDLDGTLGRELSIEVLENTKGLAEASISLFKDGYAKFKQLYLRLKPFITFSKPQFDSNILEGKVFAFTGFRNANLENLIIRNGGEVKGVSKKTTVLFAANMDSTKAKVAAKNGTPIIPAHESQKYIEDLLQEKQ